MISNSYFPLKLKKTARVFINSSEGKNLNHLSQWIGWKLNEAAGVCIRSGDEDLKIVFSTKFDDDHKVGF